MKIMRDLKNGIFLDYILTSAEVSSLRSDKLSADILDIEGNPTGLRAHLKVSANFLFSGFQIPPSREVPIEEQNDLCLEIKNAKYSEVERGCCAYFNWGFGNMTVRREDVPRNI